MLKIIIVDSKFPEHKNSVGTHLAEKSIDRHVHFLKALLFLPGAYKIVQKQRRYRNLQWKKGKILKNIKCSIFGLVKNKYLRNIQNS
jgi:hypothetical protein